MENVQANKIQEWKPNLVRWSTFSRRPNTARQPGCSNKTCHILFALTIKPTCDSTVTKSFRSETVSGYDCAKKRMFSAKLAISHIISFQRSVAPPTFHNALQHCGKTTNSCLTPQIMGKLRLDRHLPRASPDWPSCSFDSIHIMWWKHALHSKEWANAHGQMFVLCRHLIGHYMCSFLQ